MSYYNYHAKIKQKIIAGELLSYYFEPNYKNIGFALVLNFAEKSYPIREYRFQEYFDIIGKLYNITQKDKIFYTSFLKQ